MSRTGAAVLALLLVAPCPGAEPVARPRVLDEHYELELIASDPAIVTPVSVAFDRKGRLLVIESHTHFPPSDYKGLRVDRIRVLEEAAGPNKPAKFSTFYEGSSATMGLACYPKDGSIYVATRMKVFRLRDTDGDGRADEEKPIARLETPGNYPHDGLSGLAFDAEGRLYFGFGENLGEPYKVIGSDGTTLAGGGEGGGVYRCNADGSGLERVATGFWNPFGLAFDPHGRLFAVDNDPDARPPCRLVHVVAGGDYGYQFRYGRSGIHPLQAWDGDLPGTLPMVGGTGEAPCAVLPYRGQLWVTSWGDHRLERFRLTPAGASWRGTAEAVVQGDENFRPVGLAEAPDGSLYFSDWVDRSYPVHGKGRLWRLRPRADAPKGDWPVLTASEKRARDLEQRADIDALCDDDPFVRQAAVAGLVRHGKPESIDWTTLKDPRQRLGIVQALRWKDKSADQVLPRALGDADPAVRLAAVRWIADQRLKKYRSDVAAQLTRKDGTLRLYQAAAAALPWIDRGELIAGGDGRGGADVFLGILSDASRPAPLRAWALRSLPANHPALTTDRLKALLKETNPDLRREAVWTLVLAPSPASRSTLADVVTDRTEPAELRADALVGLAGDAADRRDLLKSAGSDASPAVRKEAARLLRFLENRPVDEGKTRPSPADADAWLKRVEKAGDPDAGRRVFFSAAGVGCVRCHAYAGRGASIGPDLTYIGKQLSQRRLLESILQPSKEVAPEFRSWTIETAEGKTQTGLSLGTFDSGRQERFADAEGKTFTVRLKDVVSRRVSDRSLMPEGLERLLSVEDLRDLLAFLLQPVPDR